MSERLAAWLPRRCLNVMAVVGVAVVALAATVGTSVGAFTDSEYAGFGLEVEAKLHAPLGLEVPVTYFGATAVAVAADGLAAYVWGYRGSGLSGQGVETIPSAADFSVVKLPDGRLIDTITGGSQRSNNTDACAAIAVLDSDGQVWTWGNKTYQQRLGRPVGNPGSADDHSRPGRVNAFAGAKIVDLKAGSDIFAALTENGDLYTWGCYEESFGALGQGDGAYGTVPRLILSGVHSFALGMQGGWAIVTQGWSNISYARGKDGGVASTTSDGEAGVVFWGRNEQTSPGRASGDPFTCTSLRYPVPCRLSDSAKLTGLWRDGNAADDDNETLGVRMGSSVDKGTFKQMTGNAYGSQVLLRDGSLYLWGSSEFANAGNGLGTGVKDSNDTPALQVPTKVVLEHGDQPVTIQWISNIQRMVFLLDTTGTVWIYGNFKWEIYPGPDGAPRKNTLVNSPYRIDGGDQYPGWKAGGVTGIMGVGNSLIILTRDDGGVWLAGGPRADNRSNADYLVRDSWDGNNKIPGGVFSPDTAPARPLTEINLAGLENAV
jgi:alpha-tubulin suppressor-like RCC1 family protein